MTESMQNQTVFFKLKSSKYYLRLSWCSSVLLRIEHYLLFHKPPIQKFIRKLQAVLRKGIRSKQGTGILYLWSNVAKKPKTAAFLQIIDKLVKSLLKFHSSSQRQNNLSNNCHCSLSIVCHFPNWQYLHSVFKFKYFVWWFGHEDPNITETKVFVKLQLERMMLI